MQEALRIARTVAAANTTVLLLGESGTGKEVVARAIHQWSPRAEHPSPSTAWRSRRICWRASCLGMKRRFTGATAQKKGKFELADGGTLFLDEIGELAPDLGQAAACYKTKSSSVLVASETFALTYIFWLPLTATCIQAMQRGTFREDLLPAQCGGDHPACPP